MKPSLISAFLVVGILSAAPLAAQDDDLVAKYEAKIAESWVAHGGWSEDLTAALARAKRENKVVFAYFTRSYSP